MTHEEKFAALMDRCDHDPVASQAFKNDPLSALQAADIPLVATPVPLADDGEHFTVTKHWWGVDFRMNEKLTQDVISGATGTSALTGIIAAALAATGIVAAPIVTALGGGLAAVFLLKKAEIEIADNGHGVHWPITWLQWSLLLSAAPLGPPTIITFALAIIHPLRNSADHN